MCNIRLIAGSVLLVSTIGFCCAVAAEPVETLVSGTFNRSQENGCIWVSLFYFNVDCSYEKSRDQANGQSMPWVGPTLNSVYYAIGSPEALLSYQPIPGDKRINPTMTGRLLIERGVADKSAVISGTLIVGPAARSVVTRTGAKAKVRRAIESWAEIVHEFPATPVNSAAPNFAGGYDYIIGAKGFPDLLCRQRDQQDCFPSANAGLTTDGKWGEGTWLQPSAVPIGRSTALGSNTGLQTIAKVAGYTCVDNSGGADCQRGVTIWGSENEEFDLDNLLLKIVTDDSSKVIDIYGFWTQEYRIGMGPPALRSAAGIDDSWLGGYLELHAVKSAVSPNQ